MQGVVCTRCKTDIAQARCPYCHSDIYLCAACFFAHSKLMHKDAPEQHTLTQNGYSWKVTVSPPQQKTLDVRKKGRSKKAVDREVLVKYIRENFK